jgi:hypothetical protein
MKSMLASMAVVLTFCASAAAAANSQMRSRATQTGCSFPGLVKSPWIPLRERLRSRPEALQQPFQWFA